MLYEILNSRLENVKKLVSKIAKKGGNVVYNEGEPFLKKFKVYDQENNPYTITAEVTPVEIEATYKIEGFTPVAVIDHIAVEGKKVESNIVTPLLNDVTIPEKYYTSDCHCDHCNTNRMRNKTILIQKDGEYRQVGLSCMKDYTGLDVEFLATISQYIRQIEQYSDFVTEGYHDYIDVIEYVASCINVYHKSSDVYIKSADDWGMPEYNSTKERGLEVLRTRKFTELDKAEAEDVISYLQSQPNDFENNYLTNLKTLVSCEYSKLGYAGLLASLVVFKKNQERFLENQRIQALKKLSTWQHNVGDKVELEMSVRLVYESANEWGPVNFYEMMSSDNNIYMWKTDKFFKDGIYTVKGTVKEHTVYNEINQTVLTRCKLTTKENSNG